MSDDKKTIKLQKKLIQTYQEIFSKQEEEIENLKFELQLYKNKIN